MFRYVKKFSGKDQMTKLQLYFSYGQNHNLKENPTKHVGIVQSGSHHHLIEN
jgi:hypothetical protein